MHLIITTAALLTKPTLSHVCISTEGDKSRTRHMNRTDAKRRFALENRDFGGLPSVVVDHPHYKNRDRMRLYFVTDLEVRA
jgi:hypothetical protein